MTRRCPDGRAVAFIATLTGASAAVAGVAGTALLAWLLQRRGAAVALGLVEEIRPGDIVWIPPGKRHWHGAAATMAMTHVAVAEALDGRSVDWLKHVTDAQCGAR